MRQAGGPLTAAALLVIAALGTVAAAAAPPPPRVMAPIVFVHLSDIHYSTNVRKFWKTFGNRVGDALLWAESLAPRLGLEGVVISGDITDSKTARGEALQQEAEWQAYGGLLRALSGAGVPPDRVWDVRGNHDTFNMPARAGPNDFFQQYAAEGRRRASPQQRIYVHRLPPQLAAGAGGGGGQGCLVAWLLGIDPTPEPGLRSPTNFAGMAGPALMAEARRALGGIQEQQAAAGCGAPLILAYCHYPLSTIDSSLHHVAGPIGVLLHAAHTVRPMQGLTQLLAEHNVSAVLTGHLHSAFGQHLHRLHATPSGGHMADLETAAWKDDRRFRLVAVDGGSLTFLDLMFHTRNSPRMPTRSDAAAMQDPAWQEAYAARGWAVTALEPSAAVVEHIALITSPPDGRYSPLGAPVPPTNDSSQEGWARALVYSLDDSAPAHDGLEVELAGYLPGGGGKLFAKPMQLLAAVGSRGGSGQDAAPLLFAAQGETTVSCVGAMGDLAVHCRPPADQVDIQVSVKGASGAVSRSSLQPVTLRCAPLTSSHQRCWIAAVEGGPLPLASSFPEWLGLGFNWPVLVHRLFLLVWAFQVGLMLVVPRLLGSRVLPLIAASPLLQCQPEQQQLSPSPGAAGSTSLGAVRRQLLLACLSYLLWPLAALFLCAGVTEVWGALLAYSAYLLLGPWLLYPALDGYPPALFFHYGVWGRLGSGPAEGARWHFVGTPDTMFLSLVHVIGCLLPATLWVACVVARRVQLQPYWSPASCSDSSDSGNSSAARRRMETSGASSSRSLLGGAGNCCGRWSFSAAQVAALLTLAALNCSVLWLRALSIMGPLSLLVSPGFAWMLPLAVLLVTACGGPLRRCGLAVNKGE